MPGGDPLEFDRSPFAPRARIPPPVDISAELIGLDPDHPETKAFAEHLDRIHRSRPAFTVEGYLDGVSTFADSANRAQGARWLLAVVLAGLLLLVVGYVVVDALHFVLTTLI